MAKCVIKVAGQESEEDYGREKLCRGMGAGIEGGIHAMCLLWVQNYQEED